MNDFYQLGGDVIVDNKGKVVYIYKSKVSSDRPTVNDLLKSIAESESGDPFAIDKGKKCLAGKVANDLQDYEETSRSCCKCSVM